MHNFVVADQGCYLQSHTLGSWPGHAMPQTLLSTEPRAAAVGRGFHTNLDLARVQNGDICRAQKYWVGALHATTLLGQH